VFTPSPSELREAMKLARGKLDALAGYAGEWLELLKEADEIIFAFDRAAWDAVYANVDSKVPLAMRGDFYFDEDGDKPLPRFEALNVLWEQKHAAEEAATSARIAACKATPAKRTTRKPKGG